MPKKSRSISRTTSAAKAAEPTFAGVQRPAAEFNPDYSYVKRDLKRIGILTVIFFAILITLSFILR